MHYNSYGNSQECNVHNHPAIILWWQQAKLGFPDILFPQQQFLFLVPPKVSQGINRLYEQVLVYPGSPPSSASLENLQMESARSYLLRFTPHLWSKDCPFYITESTRTCSGPLKSEWRKFYLQTMSVKVHADVHMPAPLRFLSLPRSHDHRWGLQCRGTGKWKKLCLLAQFSLHHAYAPPSHHYWIRSLDTPLLGAASLPQPRRSTLPFSGRGPGKHWLKCPLATNHHP